MIYLNKSDFPLVHDLSLFPDLGRARRISFAGYRHALRSTRLCVSHAFLHALEDMQPRGRGQTCSAQSQRLYLSQSRFSFTSATARDAPCEIPQHPLKARLHRDWRLLRVELRPFFIRNFTITGPKYV